MGTTRTYLAVLVTIAGVPQECSLNRVRFNFHEQQYNLNRYFSEVTDGVNGPVVFNNDLDGDGEQDILQVVIPHQPSCTELVIAARAAVAAEGTYDSTLYDHFLVITPNSYTSCGLAMGTVGCDNYKDFADGCWSVMSQCGQLALTIHELGHNMG